MSDQVNLSAYHQDVASLIRDQRYDEAIALCQHLLSYYPKSVETYRQMGVANLEKGDDESAQEMFRRVLSADPENSDAYNGLARVFEHQGVVDEALWHLERAFELDPFNPDIRSELTRLYVERDGKSPSRLKLTSGALARLYAREGLFPQAIQEFRSLAVESPRRLDASMALAESLWHAGQERESAQVAQDLLQSLPHCLKANLILGTVWRESGIEDGDENVRTAEALDPMNRVAQDLLGSRSPLQAVEVLVPEYVEGAAPVAPETEAEEAVEAEEVEPEANFEEWFSEEPLQEQAIIPEAEPSSELEFPGEPVVPEQAEPIEPSAAEQADVLAAFTEATLPIAEEKAETLSVEPPPAAVTQAVPPDLPRPSLQVDLPPWLIEAAPTTQPPVDSSAPPQTETPSNPALPPWLAELQKSHQEEKSSSPEMPKQGSDKPKGEAAETRTDSLPDWLKGPITPQEPLGAAPPVEDKASKRDDDSSWIRLISSVEQDQEQAPQSAISQAPTRAAPVEEPAPTEAEPGESLAEEIAELKEDQPTSFEQASEATSFEQAEAAVSEMPEWLQGLGTETPPTVIVPPPPLVADQAPEVPDWLTDLRSTPVAPTEEAQEQPAASPEAQEPTGEPSRTESEALPWDSQITPAMQTNDLVDETPATTVEMEPVESEPQPSEALKSIEPVSEIATESEFLRDETIVETPTPVEPSNEPPAVETPPAMESPAVEASSAGEAGRGPRDPKGYARLIEARTWRDANRLGDALKVYDQIVQRSPRLVGEVIRDLEELIQYSDVPLEAHRILGDAYSRVDRLADALERYRFVLDKVS